MRLPSTLSLTLVLFLMGCPSATISPPATPEQHIVAYLSVACGSETTKGANLDLAQTIITLDQMGLADKPTTRAVLRYTGRVAEFCAEMPQILQSAEPWASRALKVARAAEKVGPPGWMDSLLKVPPGALVQAAIVSAQTVASAIQSILREVR